MDQWTHRHPKSARETAACRICACNPCGIGASRSPQGTGSHQVTGVAPHSLGRDSRPWEPSSPRTDQLGPAKSNCGLPELARKFLVTTNPETEISTARPNAAAPPHRGAIANPPNRFEALHLEPDTDAEGD